MRGKSALASLSKEYPETAFGLGYSRGDGERQIFTQGPLWRGSSINVGPKARWHVGSITKTLTASIVLRLVDQGRLELEAPIESLVANASDMHEAWQSITLAQLLSHTSGLPANPPIWHFFRWLDLDGTSGRKQVFARAWKKPLKFQVGTHHYSNLGYMFIGFILENVLSETWENLVLEHIAEPLGLDTVGFGPPSGLSDPLGHSKSFSGLLPMQSDDIASDNPPWLGPAGTVHMSIGDLLTYGRAHLMAARGELPDFLSQRNSLRMQTTVSKEYGLGWVLQDGTIWHNGSNTMWYAILILDPSTDTVVVATQNAMVNADKIDMLARGLLADLRDS